jgi:hypothetical protein
MTTAHAPVPADSLRVTAWADPLVEAVGHPLRSTYVELFWLPVIGPSALLLLRRLDMYLQVLGEDISVDPDNLGRQLGLGPSGSRHAPLPRAMGRCVRFGLAKRLGRDHLAVRRLAGPLPQQRIDALPPSLRGIYGSWLHQPPADVAEATTPGTARAPDPPASGPWPRANQRAG